MNLYQKILRKKFRKLHVFLLILAFLSPILFGLNYRYNFSLNYGKIKENFVIEPQALSRYDF
ncbi:MAG: hypothetical protein ACTSPW_12165, partial [Promethearchaeota archaeon]